MIKTIANHPKRFSESMDVYYAIQYSISSQLGEIEGFRYHQNIFGDITAHDGQGNELGKIGSINGIKLLLGNAINNEVSLFDVFDISAYTMDIGNIIFDFKKHDYIDRLNDEYELAIMQLDLLILTNIEILPKFRKLDIGAHAIKDFYNNFAIQSALMMVAAEPNQFKHDFEASSWNSQMEYSNFTTDENVANYNLIAYFHKIGFQQVPTVGENLMFICTGYKNNMLDRIVLD